jgi:hypothetical protein
MRPTWQVEFSSCSPSGSGTQSVAISSNSSQVATRLGSFPIGVDQTPERPYNRRPTVSVASVHQIGLRRKMSTWVNVRLQIMRFFGKTRTIARCGPCRYKFTLTALLVSLAVAGGCWLPQPAQASEPDVPDGQSLLSQAVAQLTSLPALDAKLRQKTQLFGHEVTGSGTYLQSQSQRGLLLRLELKLQVGDQQSSLQQVCDGRFLWIRRDVASGASLGRVDMDRIREAIRTSERPTWADASTNWLAVGGLAQLLAALAENFQFSTPQAVRSEKASVWVVDGRWKPDKLAELLPDQREKILSGQPADLARLSVQLPTDVRVVLGQTDLLPYRIEYRRVESGRNQSTGDGRVSQPMVVLEILEIQRPEVLDEGLFSYQPGNQEVVDYTDLYLQALKLTPQADAKRD